MSLDREQNCRLCFGISNDLRDIFNTEHGYDKKISLYLYLRVNSNDGLSQKVCWSCANYLDNFHHFSEKITQTQRQILGDKYRFYELQPIYTINVSEEFGVLEEEEHVSDEELKEPAPKTIEVVSNLVPEPEPELAQESQPETSQENESEGDWDLPAIDLSKFPKTLISNGHLVVKGKELSAIFAQFYKLQCGECPQKPSFDDFNSLSKHFAVSGHREKPFVTCCGLKLSKYRTAILHMVRHIQPEAFKCDQCGFIVSRPEFLSNHKKTHLDPDEKPLACPHCPRRFVWKYAFDVHVATHKPAEERKFYQCRECEKKYDTPGGLSTHKKHCHFKGEKIKHVCHICAKPFAQRAGLNEHMSTIHQESRELSNLQCNECGAWLMNKRCLKTHMLLHYGPDIKCDRCSYTTKKRNLLNRHKIIHHSNEMPFACSECGKTFKLQRALTVHRKSAHVETQKAWKCNFCSRTFASSSNFYSHRKNMHPEELSKLQEKNAAEKRLKRVEAGVEAVDSSEFETTSITVVKAEEFALVNEKATAFVIKMV